MWGGDDSCAHTWEDAPVVRKGSTNGRGDLGSTLVSRDAAKTLAPGLPNDHGDTNQYRTDPGALCLRCGAWQGHLGLEPTPEMFVEHLVEIFREVRRVLREDGTLWLNLGDCYAQARGHGHWEPREGKGDERGQKITQRWANMGAEDIGLKPKDLVGIPWMVAFALRADGWYLRSDIVWSKCLSGGTIVYARTQKGEMPTSVKDLVRLDPKTVQLWNGERWTQVLGVRETPRPNDALEIEFRSGERVGCTPDHKWPTERGLLEAHELRVGDVVKQTMLPEPSEEWAPSCACTPEPPMPCTVLGPFSGSGTSGQVALDQGRHYVGLDLNQEYLSLATARILGERPPADTPPENLSILELFT